VGSGKRGEFRLLRWHKTLAVTGTGGTYRFVRHEGSARQRRGETLAHKRSGLN
jgi:hypothetical protein